jgi:hypothetical protein
MEMHGMHGEKTLRMFDYDKVLSSVMNVNH